MPHYPALIERLRRELSITQTSLAQRLKVSAMSVSRWERGVQEPSSQIFVKLGTLASDEMRWQFWEMAGLQRTHVEGSARIQNDVAIQTADDTATNMVPIPLLDAHLGASLNHDFITGSEVLEHLAAPLSWCTHPRNTVCAFVEGDSMEPLIRDGSIVSIDTAVNSPEALSSNIMVAQHPELGTKLSWLDRHDDGTYWFRSENPESGPSQFEGQWRLIGRVLWWLTRT